MTGSVLNQSHVQLSSFLPSSFAAGMLFDWRTGVTLQRWTEHKRAMNCPDYGAPVETIFSPREGSLLMKRAPRNNGPSAKAGFLVIGHAFYV